MPANARRAAIINRLKKEEQAKIEAEERAKAKGKGKGKGPSRKDKDYEHAGVAIGIKKKWKKYITEVNEVSGRIITLTIGARGGEITFISVYAPPADHKTEEKHKFHDDLTKNNTRS